MIGLFDWLLGKRELKIQLKNLSESCSSLESLLEETESSNKDLVDEKHELQILHDNLKESNIFLNQQLDIQKDSIKKLKKFVKKAGKIVESNNQKIQEIEKDNRKLVLKNKLLKAKVDAFSSEEESLGD